MRRFGVDATLRCLYQLLGLAPHLYAVGWELDPNAPVRGSPFPRYDLLVRPLVEGSLTALEEHHLPVRSQSTLSALRLQKGDLPLREPPPPRTIHTAVDSDERPPRPAGPALTLRPTKTTGCIKHKSHPIRCASPFRGSRSMTPSQRKLLDHVKNVEALDREEGIRNAHEDQQDRRRAALRVSEELWKRVILGQAPRLAKVDVSRVAGCSGHDVIELLLGLAPEMFSVTDQHLVAGTLEWVAEVL
ncbi:MAG: hypothetical protein KVP17_002584 [Porospora cf. gigantea B]|nr:MAG: hypothetical protein KVP17_002584 [Porospora cf. gigantea B]